MQNQQSIPEILIFFLTQQDVTDLTIILQERQGIGYIRAAGQCPGDRHGLLQNMRRFIFLIYDTETGSSPRGPYGHL